MDDIVKDFLVESHENLDRLDRDFVELEKGGGGTKDVLSSIFRTIHTIKGTCGFLGFKKLETLAHAAENLLAKLRDGALPVTGDIVSLLLTSVDAIRAMLASIESTESDGQEEYESIKQSLKMAQEPPAAPTHPELKPFGELLVEQGSITPSQLEPALLKQKEGDPRRIGEILVEQGAIRPDQVPVVLKKQDETRAASAMDSSVRIDVGLIDLLMNLVGELVLERNRILQFSARAADNQLSASIQRLNRITTDLQEGVMKTRMQPVGTVWSKLPRVVRDLGVACGKQVRLEQDGKETELDRTLIEAIKDPLTHLVRNSVDHGIEPPERRRQAGKPEEGLVRLKAYHEGGKVIMEITDDGAGIDPGKIKRKALDKGLISAADAESMGDQEACNLIFLPGFSTAEKVTNVSGRGVGMDVVKTNIEKIGGHVEILSRPGHGSTFKLKIPLTLAIVPALIVVAGGNRYAIPQTALKELLRVEKGAGIETIHGRNMYRLRGRLLPLVFLAQELGFGRPADLDGSLKVVVLNIDGRALGLVVEEIRDTEEIVVKPLGRQLKGVDLYSGATVMGDGGIALILDGAALARRARAETAVEEGAGNPKAGGAANLTTLLLMRVGADGRMVLPMSQVGRLEELPRKSMENVADARVVRYRDEILPVIFVQDCLPERRKKPRGAKTPLPEPAPESEILNVVVYSDSGRTIGLVVDEILDIIDHPLDIQNAGRRDGVLGTIAVNDRVTEVLDVKRIIAIGTPRYMAEPIPAEEI